MDDEIKESLARLAREKRRISKEMAGTGYYLYWQHSKADTPVADVAEKHNVGSTLLAEVSEFLEEDLNNSE